MDLGERQPDIHGQAGHAVDADGGPAEPGSDSSRRLQPYPSRVDSTYRRIEFGDASSAAAQQLRGSVEHSPRVTTQADVAVGEQYRLPATHTGQRLEHVAAQHRGAAATCQF